MGTSKFGSRTSVTAGEATEDAEPLVKIGPIGQLMFHGGNHLPCRRIYQRLGPDEHRWNCLVAPVCLADPLRRCGIGPDIDIGGDHPAEAQAGAELDAEGASGSPGDFDTIDFAGIHRTYLSAVRCTGGATTAVNPPRSTACSRQTEAPDTAAGFPFRPEATI